MIEGLNNFMKYSINLQSHKTSISLEPEFMEQLKKIADFYGKSVAKLIEEIDLSRKNNNLSSAIRIYILDFLIKNNY